MPSKEASRANLAKARAAKLAKLKKEKELAKYFKEDKKELSFEDILINEIKNLKDEINRLKSSKENDPLKPPLANEEKQKKSLSKAEYIKKSLLNF
jgi:hypothetical protein